MDSGFVMLSLLPFGLIAAVLWLARPDILALLVWPIIFLYPKNLLFNLLPMNAGLNDLFMIVLAVRLLVWSHPNRAPTFRLGFPVIWLAIGMAAMQFFSEVTGAMVTPHQGLWIDVIKNGLKGIVYISFAYILVKTLVTETDLRRHLTWFLVSLCAAFLLVWVCTWSKTAKNIWEVLSREQINSGYGNVEKTRTWGPFDSTAGLGVVIPVVIPLGVGIAAASGLGFLRVLSVFMMMGAAGAELITKTRSALTGIAVVVVGWLVLSKWRWHVAVVSVVVGVAALIYGNASGNREAIEKRLSSYELNTDAQTRFDIWHRVISHPSPYIIAFGEGQAAMEARLDATPHNGYLDILFVWGLGGLVMFTILTVTVARWAVPVIRRDPTPLGRAVGWGILWGLIAIAATALTTDPWYVINFRMLVYFALAMLWQRKQALLAAYAPVPTGEANMEEPAYLLARG